MSFPKELFFSFQQMKWFFFHALSLVFMDCLVQLPCLWYSRKPPKDSCLFLLRIERGKYFLPSATFLPNKVRELFLSGKLRNVEEFSTVGVQHIINLAL